MPRSLGVRSLTTTPSIRRSPSVISSSPAIRRSRVDLPQPEGPTKTTNSPSRMSQIDAVDDLCAAKRLAHPSQDDFGHSRPLSFDRPGREAGYDLALEYENQPDHREA